MPTTALTSEKAFEDWREDRNDWGIALDNAMWRACRWMADAGVSVTCGDAPAESVRTIPTLPTGLPKVGIKPAAK